jgi:low affinity Fe/Cu permease
MNFRVMASSLRRRAVTADAPLKVPQREALEAIGAPRQERSTAHRVAGDSQASGTTHMLTQFGTLTAHPAAFLVVLVYALLWAIFEPERLDWHGVATLATWVMTLFIQRAEYRDTQALHAKLDELLHVHSAARNELTRLDDKEPEEIERHRRDARLGD